MTVSDAINRGNNLLATSILGLAGFAFAPEAFIEDKEIYKLDDFLLFWLGIFAIGWFLKGKNKFTRNVGPVVMVWIGLAIKLMGFILEMKEADDLGDDIGGLILFILATALVTFVYIKSKKLLEK